MLSLDMLASLLISIIGMVYPVVTNNMLNTYIPQKMYKTIVISGIVVLTLYVTILHNMIYMDIDQHHSCV